MTHRQTQRRSRPPIANRRTTTRPHALALHGGDRRGRRRCDRRPVAPDFGSALGILGTLFVSRSR